MRTLARREGECGRQSDLGPGTWTLNLLQDLGTGFGVHIESGNDLGRTCMRVYVNSGCLFEKL